jgi:hypothetical protein
MTYARLDVTTPGGTMAALRTGLSAVALSVALLTGCTPATPTPSPPAPSPTCTPEAGGDPYPCSAYYYDQMVAKDKLYAEAEAVYRKFFAEEERIYRAGGITEPTPVLRETTTGEYLSDSLAIYRDLKKNHSVATGSSSLVWIHRVPDEATGGALLAMRTCVDSTSMTVRTRTGKTTRGTVVEETGKYVMQGGAIMLANATSQVVTKCS